MKNYPLCYVILVNWNGYSNTVSCIKSLLKSTYQNLKIIIVDNGSKNNEALKIEKLFPNTTVIKNKTNLGFSRANNQGINHALEKKADYIFILNNDTIVDKNCINNLILFCYKNNFKGIISPKVLFYNSSKIWSLGGRHQPLTTIPRLIGQGKPSKAYKKAIIKPEFLTGSALFMHKTLFNKIGMFDEDYFAYHEDIDLSYRARKSGFDLICLTDSVIWHKVSKSTKQKPGKVGKTMGYLMARNGLIFGHKNYKGFRKVYYIFAQIFIKLPLYLIFKVNDIESAIAYVDGVIQGFKLIINYKAVDSRLKYYV